MVTGERGSDKVPTKEDIIDVRDELMESLKPVKVNEIPRVEEEEERVAELPQSN